MAVRIGFGLADFPFSGAAAFWRWIEQCEAGGIDSLWQSDRMLAPVPFLECMSLMAALAGATRKMKFGMNVAAIGFRDPFLLARECATIDYLSDGRLLPGFGIGALSLPDWNVLGVATEGQGARTDEALEIMQRLWRGETLDFEGRFFRYRGASILPLPVQQPLPLWLGGSSPAAIRRTARFGTGWHAGGEPPQAVGPIVAAIRRETEALGRSIDSEHFSAAFFYRLARPDDPVAERQRAMLGKLFPGRDVGPLLVIGDAGDVIERVRDYVAAGITKFILRPLGEGDADIGEQTALLIREVLPEVHRAHFASVAPS